MSALTQNLRGPTSKPSDHDADPLDAVQVKIVGLVLRFATVGGFKVAPRNEEGSARGPDIGLLWMAFCLGEIIFPRDS